MEIALQRIQRCIDTNSTTLDLSCLGLTVLPDNLHPNLDYLDCYYNQLTVLPDNLPRNLKVLLCNDNKLTVLPDNLPPNLVILGCYNNKLTNIQEKYYNIIFNLNYTLNQIKIENERQEKIKIGVNQISNLLCDVNLKQNILGYLI